MQPQLSLTKHSLPLDGAHLHWEEAGQGTPLILIHGSLCDLRYWRWQMPEFSRHFRVIAVSLPGCWPDAIGAAEAPDADAETRRRHALHDPRYGIAAHVRAIIALCEHVADNGPVHLLGHSRGAQVALEAALATPGCVGRLVLADPGFAFTGEPAEPAVHMQVANRLGHAPLDEVIGAFVDAVNGPDTWRRTVPWFKEMVRANAWTLLPQLKDFERSVDLERLQALSCPVLLVGGEHSPARYGSRIDTLLRAVPGAEKEVIPRAAHGMNLANARRFNEAVLRFLVAQHDA